MKEETQEYLKLLSFMALISYPAYKIALITVMLKLWRFDPVYWFTSTLGLLIWPIFCYYFFYGRENL